MLPFTVTAYNYTDYESSRHCADYSDYADCVTYCNQGTEYGDSGYGDWFYAPDAPLPTGEHVIYFGTFGNDHSPGAAYYTYAAIYDNAENYAADLKKWEAYPEYLDEEEDDSEFDDEDCEDEEQEEPCEGDYILAPSGPLGGTTTIHQSGKCLTTLVEWDDITTFIRQHMEDNQFYPSIWQLSDHGNYHPISLDD